MYHNMVLRYDYAKQNRRWQLCTHFDGHFGGHRNVAVLYRAHRPMEAVCGFNKSQYMPPSGEHLLQLYPIGHASAGCFGHITVKKRYS